MGQFWMTVSTTSEMGVVKSGLQNSGWKKISGPRKRSYPTSTEKDWMEEGGEEKGREEGRRGEGR